MRGVGELAEEHRLGHEVCCASHQFGKEESVEQGGSGAAKWNTRMPTVRRGCAPGLQEVSLESLKASTELCTGGEYDVTRTDVKDVDKEWFRRG